MPNTAQGTASRGEGDLALVFELKHAVIYMAEYPHGTKRCMYGMCAEIIPYAVAKLGGCVAAAKPKTHGGEMCTCPTQSKELHMEVRVTSRE